MPATVNSADASSSAGISDDDGRRWWSREMKNSRNLLLISSEVMGLVSVRSFGERSSGVLAGAMMRGWGGSLVRTGRFEANPFGGDQCSTDREDRDLTPSPAQVRSRRRGGARPDPARRRRAGRAGGPAR